MDKILFVGENRSHLAKKMNVTWKDGRLAAKQLFDALDAIGFPRTLASFAIGSREARERCATGMEA